MRTSRLSVLLSASALAVAVLGVTPAGEAARSVTVAFAKNAAKVGGFKPSKTSKKNTVVVRGANGKIDQASLPTIRGERGPQGAPGDRGLQGPPGERGPEGPANPNAVNAENADKLDGFDSTHFAEQAAIAALEARVAALEAKLAAVSYDSSANLLRVTGANVQILDGSGDTHGTVNGLGNLILGYNGGAQTRSGSHNLVIGDSHTYTGSGGFVGGGGNTISGGSVFAGSGNTASGGQSSVTGGFGNTASDLWTSVTGGANNRATGSGASVSGGTNNVAGPASFASVTGGRLNVASGFEASITGGRDNTASNEWASVTGGSANTASGARASVTGGESNVASAQHQWLAGTLVTRSAMVAVPGGSIGNGDYHTANATATCLASQMLFGGGAFWTSEVDDEELPLISSQPNATMTGWTVRGGNDGSTTDRTLNVQALCLGP
jgi:hypothetical protein